MATADGKREARRAGLLGATGLVGGHILRLLEGDPLWSEVHVLARREAPESGSKTEWHTVDFEEESSWRPHLEVDDLFCALGTTMKKAGSKAAFRAIDHDLPLALAQEARARGCSGFHLVSSVGADPSASFFYYRVKGDLEEALRALRFERLTIVRPSMLIGSRDESRMAERLGGGLMRAVAPIMLGPLKRLRAVRAQDVAAALLEGARREEGAQLLIESEEIVTTSG